MTGTPKCPHGCDAVQEAGQTFYDAGRRIPAHRDKHGGIVLGNYENVLMRWWTCSKCGKTHGADEPKKKPINKKLVAAKGKKRGKKPKQRKRSTAN